MLPRVCPPAALPLLRGGEGKGSLSPSLEVGMCSQDPAPKATFPRGVQSVAAIFSGRTFEDFLFILTILFGCIRILRGVPTSWSCSGPKKTQVCAPAVPCLEGTRVTATSVCMTRSHRVPSESGRTVAAPGSQGLALLRRAVGHVSIRIWAKLL